MRYLLVCFLFFSMISCQQDSAKSSNNDVKLFADFYVRYLQNEQQLKAEAIFKRGLDKEKANKIELEGDVKFDGQLLNPIKLNNSIFRYQLESKRAFKENTIFKIEHDKGTTTEHSIGMSPIGKFSLENGSASKKNGFLLAWDGANLTDKERLLVLVTDKNNKAHSISINGPSKNQQARIKGVDLQPLATGAGYIYLVKKTSNTVTKDDMIISSLAEYYTDRILIEILE